VLKIVADAHRGLAEPKEKRVLGKRLFKAGEKSVAQAQKEALEKIDKNESNFALHSIKPPTSHKKGLRSSERKKNNV
jgi:hypothetical protein